MDMSFIEISVGLHILLVFHCVSARQLEGQTGLIEIHSNSFCLSAIAVITSQTCDNEVFQARCSHPQKIFITQARFGHIEVSRCVGDVFDTVGFLGCYANITDLIQLRCSGESRCDVERDDSEILSTKECGVGLPMYMDISHTCIPGELPALLLWIMPYRTS
jgi:hypothetical protein